MGEDEEGEELVEGIALGVGCNEGKNNMDK